MTDNQEPEPTGGPHPGVPVPGQQPYPTQPLPPQQYPQHPYPPQPYPAAYPGQPYPGQPYPGQPYPGQQAFPGQPYGAQPPQPYPGQQPLAGPQQPYPGQQPYGPQVQQPYLPPYGPAGQPPPGKPRGKGGLILGTIAGVAVLGVIAVFALPKGTPTSGAVPTPLTTTAGATTGTAVPASATAAAAVQGYLEAIASGDSASAIAFAVKRPMEQSLLTDALLAANRAIAPITGITTTEGMGSDHQSVRATYTLGGTPVDTTFEVSRVNGAWLLDAVASPLPLDLSGMEGVDLTINGTQLLNLNPAVFPGRYTVAPASGWYKLSDGTVEVAHVTGSAQAQEAKLSLSGSGISAIRKAAQARLKACVKKKSLAPAGCAFNVFLPGRNTVRSSSITWRVTSGGSAMGKLKPTLAGADTAVAKVSVKARVDCSSTNGRRWRGYASIHDVYATLTGNKVQITFGA